MELDPRVIFSGFFDPSPCFICENLKDQDPEARYRLPLRNLRLPGWRFDPDPKASAAALARLPKHPGVQQLMAFVAPEGGVSLWAPERLHSGQRDQQLSAYDRQLSLGSLLIFPPAEWDLLRSEFDEWQINGDGSAHQDLPYGIEDIVPFAGPNFSPDFWFVVLRGPMAGNVCWWTHDGDSVMNRPWAIDLHAWAKRVFSEDPDNILGGTIQFSAVDSIDPAPADAALYPIEYRPEMPAKI